MFVSNVEPFTHLSRTWRTVAYDHRGTGATIAPVESISLENIVDDIFAVMDQLNMENCVLAAESAGGMATVSAALREPDRFDGLVLVDALIHNPDDQSDATFIHGLKTNFEQTVGQFVDSCVVASEPDSAAIRSWGRKILARASARSAVRLLECTHGIDLRPRLAEIQLPTLIIHGDSDALVPLSASEYMASQFPRSQLQVIKGAGHVPTVTRPFEVAQAINQYFS